MLRINMMIAPPIVPVDRVKKPGRFWDFLIVILLMIDHPEAHCTFTTVEPFPLEKIFSEKGLPKTNLLSS
jgi:hypothetical protein